MWVKKEKWKKKGKRMKIRKKRERVRERKRNIQTHTVRKDERIIKEKRRHGERENE